MFIQGVASVQDSFKRSRTGDQRAYLRLRGVVFRHGFSPRQGSELSNGCGDVSNEHRVTPRQESTDKNDKDVKNDKGDKNDKTVSPYRALTCSSSCLPVLRMTERRDSVRMGSPSNMVSTADASASNQRWCFALN